MQPIVSVKKKLYVSISKQASKEVIKKVMDYLNCFEVTVFTYDGGSYNQSDLDRMDAMLVIPPHGQGALNADCLGEYIIGKGQYTEIKYFITNVNRFDNVYIVSNLDNGLYIDELNSIKPYLTPINWDKWGCLYTNAQCIDLNNYGFKSLAEYDELKESYLIEDLAKSSKPITVSKFKFHLALTRNFI